MLNITSFIFGSSDDSALAVTGNYFTSTNPVMLNKSECNQFLMEVLKDYVSIAPNYASVVEHNYYYVGLLMCLPPIVAFILLPPLVRRIANKCSGLKFKEAPVPKTVITPTSDSQLKEHIVEHSLLTHTLDRKYLHKGHLNKSDALIAIKVTGQTFNTGFCSLIKGNLTTEDFIHGTVVRSCEKDKSYLLRKLDTFLSKTSTCRVLINFEIESDESESQVCKLKPSYSGGDFTHVDDIQKEVNLTPRKEEKETYEPHIVLESPKSPKGDFSKLRAIYESPHVFPTIPINTNEESVACSPRCDEKQIAKRPSKIPTIVKKKTSKYFAPLANKPSANSVEIVEPKESTISINREVRGNSDKKTE